MLNVESADISLLIDPLNLRQKFWQHLISTHTEGGGGKEREGVVSSVGCLE